MMYFGSCGLCVECVGVGVVVGCLGVEYYGDCSFLRIMFIKVVSMLKGVVRRFFIFYGKGVFGECVFDGEIWFGNGVCCFFFNSRFEMD